MPPAAAGRWWHLGILIWDPIWAPIWTDPTWADAILQLCTVLFSSPMPSHRRQWPWRRVGGGCEAGWLLRPTPFLLRPAAWGPAGVLTNGGGPRVPTRARTKICLTPVLFDLAGVSGSGRLRRRSRMDVMPRDCWIGWYSVATHGAARSSASVATMGKSMVKSEAEKVIEAEIWRTSNGVRSICIEEELAWCFMNWSSGM